MSLATVWSRIFFSNSKKWLLTVGILVSYLWGLAQTSPISAVAIVDTNNILIGEQVRLDLRVQFPTGGQIALPVFADSVNSMEIVERSKMDTTLSKDGNTTTLSQSYSVTAFNEGIYGLGPFKYYYRQNDTALTDSIYTELLTIKVESVAVDTTQVIKNIKGPMEMPFHWGEILHYIVAISVCLLLLALFLWWLKTRKKPAEIMQTASRPAHESSMEELEALQQKELWQKGRYKEYQIEVSDIIRTYIEKRFSVPAMELTSDETLHHFSGKRLSVEAIEKLEYILLLADTVKFAKAVPLGTEHELSMKYAKDFVNMTKQIVDTSSAKDEKEREEMP